MGDSEHPLVSDSDTDEVTVRPSVSPQLIATTADAEMESAAMEKNDVVESSSGDNSLVTTEHDPRQDMAQPDSIGGSPAILESATSDAHEPRSAHIGSSDDHAPVSAFGHSPGSGSHVAASAFGIAPLGAAPIGIAPLGSPAVHAYGVSPLEIPSPIDAAEEQRGPDAASARETEQPSLQPSLVESPVHSAIDDTVTHILPRVEAATPLADELALDSGWGTARPPATAPDPTPDMLPLAETTEAQAAAPEAAAPEVATADEGGETTTEKLSAAAPAPGSDFAATHAVMTPPAPDASAAEVQAVMAPAPEASAAEAHQALLAVSYLGGAETAVTDETLHRVVESPPEDEQLPSARMARRSKPPPKPAGYASDRPPADLASAPAEQSFGYASSASPSVHTGRPVPATDADVVFANRLRKSKRPAVLWAGSVIATFFIGWAVAGASNASKLTAAATSASAAVQAAREAAIAETKAAIPPPSPLLDLSQPAGVRSIIEIIKTEPGLRTRIEAVALGRQWQEKRFDEFTKFSAEVRRNSQKLDDPKVRAQALEFVRDRLTGRVSLELLSELPSSKALDLLYEVWIGGKDRNETTQLAETLLLAKDVRKRVSGALDIALALREKPTNCSEINQLVDRAIREGDRRSANQLVTTAARQNCGPSGAEDCVKCLSDMRNMRKAILAAAARPDPVQ